MEDLHDKWPHRWITPKAECKKSPICGFGIFAVKNIKKGEVVAIIGGIVVPVSEIKEYWDKIGHFGAQVNDDFYIVPSTKEEVEKDGSTNHSCEPNVGWVGDIQIIAMKDIKKGDEITADYGMYDTISEPFKCNCGSKNCRKIIKPDDWKIPELQKKYYEYFSPYLKEKIKK